MAFLLELFPVIEFSTKAILGAIGTIIFLIVVELLEVNNDYKDLKEIFSPLILGLIITFIFIVIARISEIIR